MNDRPPFPSPNTKDSAVCGCHHSSTSGDSRPECVLCREENYHHVFISIRVRKQWIIRDGDRRIRTGLAELERVAAERQLTDYLVKTAEVPEAAKLRLFH